MNMTTKPSAKDDLKSLPLPAADNKMGSSPDGLSQAESQKRPLTGDAGGKK